MSFQHTSFLFLALLALVIGCSEPPNNPSAEPDDLFVTPIDTNEPKMITVQHCLISFKGSKMSKPISRTKEEAFQLATDLLSRARGGEDFDKIVEEYTDDAHPGIYKMANHGESAVNGPGTTPETMVHQRSGMVAAFGDVGFALEVGEFGMSKYHESKSPYGYHIIKRLE